jgi:hypothetical protein
MSILTGGPGPRTHCYSHVRFVLRLDERICASVRALRLPGLEKRISPLQCPGGRSSQTAVRQQRPRAVAEGRLVGRHPGELGDSVAVSPQGSGSEEALAGA